MQRLLTLCLTLLAIYLLVVGSVYLGQRALMFSASTDRVAPSALGVSRTIELDLLTKNGEQLISWYTPAHEGHPTILYLHGNGGSIGTRLSLQQQILGAGYGLFMAGYPGYGGSEGSPSEAGLVEAAQLAYQQLVALNVAPKQMVVFGESLGSSVAIQLAVQEPIGALVLAAPMYSILEIAQGQYPYLPVSLLLKDTFLSYQYIGDVEAPLLVLHGSEDAAIPMDSAKRLFALANEPKRFEVIQGAGHNNLFDFDLLQLLEGFAAETQAGP